MCLELCLGARSADVAVTDENVELESVLPAVTSVTTLELDDPYDLFTEEEQQDLVTELDALARQRRRVEAGTGRLRLS